MVSTRRSKSFCKQPSQPLRRRRSCTIHTLISKAQVPPPAANSNDDDHLPDTIPEELEELQGQNSAESESESENQPRRNNSRKCKAQASSSKAAAATSKDRGSKRRGKRKFSDVSQPAKASSEASASKRFKELEERLHLAQSKCLDIEVGMRHLCNGIAHG